MNNDQANSIPWASFCMSTYKRPEFLKTQLGLVLQQTFTDFEIVIADNDPDESGKTIATSFNDPRIKYAGNGGNIGIVPSYNRSVDRALGQYIVMITDDDPVDINLLSIFNKLMELHPGYSLYGGLKRKHTCEDEVEVISKEDFMNEFLDVDKTAYVLWSSCLFKKEALVAIGKLPDYGAPHLVDHALLAMAGSINGAVLINRVFGNIGYHQNNTSKSNFDLYYTSCTGFYELLNNFIKHKPLYEKNRKAIVKHLHKWFIVFVFSLINYYRSAANKDQQNIEKVKTVADKILQLPYMRSSLFHYRAKLFILSIKYGLGIKK